LKKVGDSKLSPSYLLVTMKLTMIKVEYYFSHPKNKTDAAILILPDVIGHGFINTQLIADQFAANGYFVAVPDIFNGDPLPLNRGADFDFAAWLAKHGSETVDPVVETAIKELKGNYGIKKIGTVGYCFGAKYVVRFLKKGVTDAGYIAHPSWVLASELKDIEGPLSIAAAGEFRLSFVQLRRGSVWQQD
jgi:dienelactone hydrolase